MYTVSDVAEMLNISKHTIRYYTDQGLIPNVQRDEHNNRLFDETAVNWFIGVRHLKQCGMSLKDIRLYNQLCLEGDKTIEDRYNIIAKHQKIANAQLLEAKTRCQYLENKLNLYQQIKDNQRKDTSNPHKWAQNIQLDSPAPKQCL